MTGYRILALGTSEVTHRSPDGSASFVDLYLEALQRLAPETQWGLESLLVYPSPSMAARVRVTVERYQPAVLLWMLGANTFSEATVMFSIRRRHPRLYPIASRLIAYGKSAAGGGAEGSASLRGILFRLPRALARVVFGTATMLDREVAFDATRETLKLLHEFQLPVVCRLAEGSVQQSDQAAAAMANATAYNDEVISLAHGLVFKTFDARAELGDAYGRESSGLHYDLPTREYTAGRAAALTLEALGRNPAELGPLTPSLAKQRPALESLAHPGATDGYA
jgi:hypothetical protein